MTTLTEYLNTLLTSANLFTRREWAANLGVSEGTLSHWIGGRHIPGPEQLQLIRELLRWDSRAQEHLLPELEALLAAPITQTVERPRRTMGRTLGHYMLRPMVETFNRTAAALPHQGQEAVLIEATALADAWTPTPRFSWDTSNNADLAESIADSGMIIPPRELVPCER